MFKTIAANRASVQYAILEIVLGSAEDASSDLFSKKNSVSFDGDLYRIAAVYPEVVAELPRDNDPPDIVNVSDYNQTYLFLPKIRQEKHRAL